MIMKTQTNEVQHGITTVRSRGNPSVYPSDTVLFDLADNTLYRRPGDADYWIAVNPADSHVSSIIAPLLNQNSKTNAVTGFSKVNNQLVLQVKDNNNQTQEFKVTI